jgi:hypothetical protein
MTRKAIVKRMCRTAVYLLIVVLTAISLQTAAQTSRWRDLEHARLVRFDWSCASQAA